ncbi:MAG: type IV pilus twitching motility protein PilT [Planctomycetota bacterium]|nr:type IV pilus twitching motility protein PilT [Planctomycetota bacterium]MDI6787593.1 type IV pilus twitching motility protein PilT [Planctomycetota bacterium]
MAVELNKFLDVVVEQGVSDLHLTVGLPPMIRHHGHLKALNHPPLTKDDTVALMRSITSERHQQEIKEKGGCDFAFAYEKKARFRVAIYTQKGFIGITLRQIPSRLRTIEELGLPDVIKEIINRPRGLVLVTGPTGCGKTTSLAAMINHININSDCHIVTVEDPIEYYHEHKKSIITQREVFADIGSFSEAIVKALRMDPDVVLVGEMRDLDTIQTAITAAETGHLVFGTLHTTGAARTINRLVDAFPVAQQEQVRTQLATALIAIISQVLLPRADAKGVIAAYEIMIATPAVQHLIRENEPHKIISAIQTGTKLGMVLLDDFLFKLFIQKKITYQDMMEYSVSPADLAIKMQEYAKQQQAALKKA